MCTIRAYELCWVYNVSRLVDLIEKATISRFHYILLALCSLIYALAAMNVMLIGATLPSIVTEWELNKIITGVLLGAGGLGMFVGALGFGVVADIVGRKKALIVTVVLASIFTGLCSIAWDVTSMLILRFLAGIGLGSVLPQPGVYISEYIPADKRGQFTGLVETSWVYGALLAISFPYVIIPLYGWRLAFLVAFIPLILIPFIVAFMPESIRYLESKGLNNTASKLLKKYGLTVGSLKKLTKRTVRKYSVKESLGMLWSKKYGVRTFMLWLTWFVLVYTYHGIFLWLPRIFEEIVQAKESLGYLHWALIITLFQIPGYYSATFLLDKFGRKPVLGIYLIIAGIGSFIFSISHGLLQILITMAIISFFNLGAWAALYTYTPELYATRIRGTGVGAAASFGRLAMILGPYLTGYIWSGWGLSFVFIVFAAVQIINAIVVGAFRIETKGKRLEEISS